MEDSSQLIEADGWSNHWKIRNGDESVSRGTGPWICIYPSHFGASNCLGCIIYIGIIFQGLVNFWIFPSFSVLNIHIFGKMSYHSDERAFHNSLVASHHPLRRAARFHQFVFLTHLRLKPWRCSRLCWCPVCKEGIVYGKWFAHWQCTLCWHSPAAFTVWWINQVDRLTCSRCGTLRNNVLKQLLKSQLEITWSWVPSTPRKVQNLMSGNRAVYQTNEPNECAQCVWLREIGRTNITGKASSAAMLLQRHSTHEDIRESVRVNYWIGSHNPARTSSGSVFELWISDSDGFEWFFAMNFLYPKFAVLARSKQLMPVVS